jgi:hypothetical protein
VSSCPSRRLPPRAPRPPPDRLSDDAAASPLAGSDEICRGAMCHNFVIPGFLDNSVGISDFPYTGLAKHSLLKFRATRRSVSAADRISLKAEGNLASRGIDLTDSLALGADVSCDGPRRTAVEEV